MTKKEFRLNPYSNGRYSLRGDFIYRKQSIAYNYRVL